MMSWQAVCDAHGYSQLLVLVNLLFVRGGVRPGPYSPRVRTVSRGDETRKQERVDEWVRAFFY